MKAAILAVGDELLAPGRAETNPVFLTDELAKLGIPVVFRAVVSDDASAIEAFLRRALLGADVVFLTGGLGPTADDVTRDAAARALSREMELDADWLERIQKRFDRRGIVMPGVNRKQAMVPIGADLLPNRRGTAPGLWMRVDDDKAVVLLPGPPAELRPMFEAEVEPRLSQQAGDVVYDVRKLWVTGLAESAVEQRVCETYLRYKNPATTILASAGQVELRLTATGTNAGEAVAVNDVLVAELRALLGDHLFSECEEELEEVVGQLLVSQKKRIAVAESLTGGLIASRLTDIPGASAYFDEAFVTYKQRSKNLGARGPRSALRERRRGKRRGCPRHGGRRARAHRSGPRCSGDRHRRPFGGERDQAGRARLYRSRKQPRATRREIPVPRHASPSKALDFAGRVESRPPRATRALNPDV